VSPGQEISAVVGRAIGSALIATQAQRTMLGVRRRFEDPIFLIGAVHWLRRRARMIAA
jgi:hypothetical protein